MNYPVVVYDISSSNLAEILNYDLKMDGIEELDFSQRDTREIIEWKFVPTRWEYIVQDSKLILIEKE